MGERGYSGYCAIKTGMSVYYNPWTLNLEPITLGVNIVRRREK